MKAQEIKVLRKEKKLTQDQLGELCGVGKSAVSNWEKGKADPSGPALKILEQLRNGDLVVSEVSDLEAKLLDQNVQVGGFKNREEYLTASLKHLLLHGEFMPIKGKEEANVTPLPTAEDSNLVDFPFFGAVAAGQPVESQLDGETFPANSSLDPKKHAIIEINGQSAEPKFSDGDKWIIELIPETRTARKGKPAVFRDSQGCYLKIYNGNGNPFSSVNPNSPDVQPDETLKLVGYPVEKVES